MKYFLLDKTYAVQNMARCVGISDKPFTEEEKKQLMEAYNATETIVYKSTPNEDGIDDIPHHIEYVPELDTIVEKKPEPEVAATEVYQDMQPQETKIFDEDVVMEPDAFYFYIDKHIADTEFRAETIATFTKPLLNPLEYFQKESYMIKGKDIPFYITVVDGVVKEATEFEKLQRGQRKLGENEVVVKDQIITMEEGWYIKDEELIKVSRPMDMAKPVFNEEIHIWEETATQTEIDLYKARKQYNEYEFMNNIVSGRRLQNEALYEEYVTMMLDLEDIILQLETQLVSRISNLTDVVLPEPSDDLSNIKNMLKKLGDSYEQR